MTLVHSPLYTAPPAPLNSFQGVLAQPERHLLPGGELLVFRFGNGYGAALNHSDEFCVLDCTGSEPTPVFDTPVASEILSGLGDEAVTRLLTQTEALPPHPRLLVADHALLAEAF